MLAIDDEVAISVVSFNNHHRGEEPDAPDRVDEPLHVSLARFSLVRDDFHLRDRKDGEGEISAVRRVLEGEAYL
jgi:hypothetical protein